MNVTELEEKSHRFISLTYFEILLQPWIKLMQSSTVCTPCQEIV